MEKQVMYEDELGFYTINERNQKEYVLSLHQDRFTKQFYFVMGSARWGSKYKSKTTLFNKTREVVKRIYVYGGM